MKASYPENPISPYDEALQFIMRHPGTGGASSVSKLILSLYNDICGFSFAECVGNLDSDLTALALRIVADYAQHGETDNLRAAGKLISVDLYPGLWEMGIAMQDARAAVRAKWEADRCRAELDALDAAEAALFIDPAKLVPVDTAKGMFESGDRLDAYYNAAGDWRSVKLVRESVHAAIDTIGGAELSGNCPENSQTLAVRIDSRVYYVSTDYDAREAYLEATVEARKPIPTSITIPPRDSAS